VLDLDSIKARAASRLALARDAATPANPANWLTPDSPISQLATLATPAARNPGRYALTPAEADAAHADAWDDGAIARFQARTRHIRRLGFTAQDADDLAERLHLRDVHADYRHLCVECRHYRPHRCGNHRKAGLTAAEVGRDLATMFQDCAGYQPELTP
jgi:hypothetical protein